MSFSSPTIYPIGLETKTVRGFELAFDLKPRLAKVYEVMPGYEQDGMRYVVPANPRCKTHWFSTCREAWDFARGLE